VRREYLAAYRCTVERSILLTVVLPVRRCLRKIVRAYDLLCAREDAHAWNLVIPAGVWLCQRCPHVTFDIARLNDHYRYAHSF
jgi:hypothetical protein